MYARGILFGKMKYELGDHSFVRCPEMGLVADLEFKTKGWVGGMYNAIGGTIKNEKTGEVLYEFSGLWSDEMFVKDMKVSHQHCCENPGFHDADSNPRLATKSCSLMRTELSHHNHLSGPLRSRRRESRRDFGKRLRRPSRRGTTKSQPTRRRRSRTLNEMKLPRGPRKVSNGFLDFLGE